MVSSIRTSGVKVPVIFNDGSWPVDFSLDVDLECNLERILKGLLHWQIECWWGRLFCSYVYGRICEDRFCGLIHCGGGRAGTPPVRALRNSGRVPLSLQKNAKGGGQDCSSGSLIVKCNAPGWDVRCGK